MTLRSNSRRICLLIGLIAGANMPDSAVADRAADSGVAVIIGSQAGELERYAASQLCEYLDKLYGIKTKPVTGLPDDCQTALVIGTPQTYPTVAAAVGQAEWPEISQQGIVTVINLINLMVSRHLLRPRG